MRVIRFILLSSQLFTHPNLNILQSVKSAHSVEQQQKFERGMKGIRLVGLFPKFKFSQKKQKNPVFKDVHYFRKHQHRSTMSQSTLNPHLSEMTKPSSPTELIV